MASTVIHSIHIAVQLVKILITNRHSELWSAITVLVLNEHSYLTESPED